MTIFGVLQTEHKKKYNKTIEKNSLRVALNYFLDNYCFTLSCHFNENVSQKTYLEPSQTTKTQLFGNNIHSFQLLIIFQKSSILDVWLAFEYASRSGCKILKIEIYFELECLRMSSALSQV